MKLKLIKIDTKALSFEEIEKKNKERKERIEKERERHNQKTMRSYKIKK